MQPNRAFGAESPASSSAPVTAMTRDHECDRYDEVDDGIITADPQQVQIGRRDSIYFEAEIIDPAVWGTGSF